jgi:hypothetical protein
MVLHVLASPIQILESTTKASPIRAYVSRRTFAVLTGCELSDLCASTRGDCRGGGPSTDHGDMVALSGEVAHIHLRSCMLSRLDPPKDPTAAPAAEAQAAPDPLAIALKEHLAKEASPSEQPRIELACVPDAQVTFKTGLGTTSDDSGTPALALAHVPDGCVAFCDAVLGQGKGKSGVDVGDLVR